MLVRGVVVSYETIRSWCARFDSGRTTSTSCISEAPNGIT